MDQLKSNLKQSLSVLIDENRLTLQLTQATLSIEVSSQKNPLIYTSVLAQIPPNIAIFFNSLSHLFNYLSKQPEHLIITPPLLSLTISALDSPRTIDIYLESTELSQEEVTLRSIKYLRLDNERLAKHNRKFRMKMDSAIYEASSTLCSLQQKRQAVEERIKGLRARQDEAEQRKRKLQEFIERVDKAMASKEQKII